MAVTLTGNTWTNKLPATKPRRQTHFVYREITGSTWYSFASCLDDIYFRRMSPEIPRGEIRRRLNMPDKLCSAVHIINANTARTIPIPSLCNEPGSRCQQLPSLRGAGGRGFLALRHSKRSAFSCNLGYKTPAAAWNPRRFRLITQE